MSDSSWLLTEGHSGLSGPWCANFNHMCTVGWRASVLLAKIFWWPCESKEVPVAHSMISNNHQAHFSLSPAPLNALWPSLSACWETLKTECFWWLWGKDQPRCMLPGALTLSPCTLRSDALPVLCAAKTGRSQSEFIAFQRRLVTMIYGLIANSPWVLNNTD